MHDALLAGHRVADWNLTRDGDRAPPGSPGGSGAPRIEATKNDATAWRPADHGAACCKGWNQTSIRPRWRFGKRSPM